METKKTRSRSSAKKTSKKTTTKKTTKKTASKAASSKKSSRKKASKKKGAGPAIDVQRTDNMVRASCEIGGRTLTLETGRMAKLADAAVVARYGDTMTLSTAQSSSGRDDIDFFPLTVDYRERYPAAGRFPGGFFKREGRPTNREILTCRIIDRSIRPLFPDGFKKEVQVLSQVLSTDGENESDILAAVGSFAALAISSIPHEPHLGAVRIGMIDDEFVINPTWTQLKSPENTLNLTVAGHKDAVVMVEAGAVEFEEDRMLEALRLAGEVCADIAALVEAFAEEAGKEKMEFTPPERDDKLDKAIERKFGKALKAIGVGGGSKHERGAAKKELMTEVYEAFPAPEDADPKQHKKYVGEAAHELVKQGERDSILAGSRADGRDWKTVRPITVDVGVLPRVHGSVLFTRGETQALCVATLGTPDDVQNRDGIYPEDPQRFMLHYTFPPFCVGETRRMMGPGRREIGHGTLAERSVDVVLPEHEEFPYTMRVTSEILESNGSSSMASVCGGTLALMDAGVPLRQPVAGIAMGLVMEGKDYAILSDILGSEDHCGDMDFKVAGSGKGITALQMDIKCDGLTQDILAEAMEQARMGRLHILREMLKSLAKPRPEISPNAPRILTVRVPVDKIGAIIGPGGKNIRALQADYEVRISIDDEGLVSIGGFDGARTQKCADYIGDMTREVEPGEVYNGKVTSIKDFGAFIEILPGQEGLCHVSELSNNFIHAVTDVVRIGDEIEVKVLDIDDFGKIKLSHKALLDDEDGEDEQIFRRGKDGGSADDFEDEIEDEDEVEEEVVEDDFEDDLVEDDDEADEDDEEVEEAPRRERGGRERGGRDRGERGDRSDRGRGGRERSRGGRDDRPRRSREDRDDRPRRSRDGDDRPRRPRGDRDDRPRRSREDRDERPRRDRDERPARGRGGDREDRPARGRGDRDERPQRSREDRDQRPRRDRDERPRRDQDRDERPRRPRSDRDDRPRGDREDRPRRERSDGDAPRGRSRSRRRD